MKVQIISQKKELEEKGLFLGYVHHATRLRNGDFLVQVKGKEVEVKKEFVSEWDEHYFFDY